MKHILVVQSLQPLDKLDQSVPDLALVEEGLFAFSLRDLLQEISIIRVLHDDAGSRDMYHRLLEPSSKKASR